MKLQFSLATLLVCVTVFGEVAAICSQMPAYDSHVEKVPIMKSIDLVAGTINYQDRDTTSYVARSQTFAEFALRLLIWEPLAIAGVLAALWAIRRLRQPNRPTVG